MTAALLAVSASVNAEDFVLEKGINELAPEDRIVNATYKATKSCKVLVQTEEVFDVTCAGVKYDMQYAPASSHGAYRYEVDVEYGQVVSICTDFLWKIPTVVWISESAGTDIKAPGTSVDIVNKVYDLGGRKSNLNAPGIYIINGKKYVNRK